VEPYWLKIYRQPITIAGLPPAFDGLRLVQLSDLHSGRFLPLSQIERALALANGLHPDVIVLTGDYVHKDPKYIPIVYQLLSRLHAPLGVYAVLGNHDQWVDPELKITRRDLAEAGLVDLTNRSVALSRQGQLLWLAGVADMITQTPDLGAALAQVPPQATVILLSHSPDFVDQVRDPRVALMLSGHTHGGQVNLPLLGPLIVPSTHGVKFAAGLVREGNLQVYTNRGVGMAVLPLRFRCRPEVTLLTLHAAP
jgi:predicted MPP superfamily phosphohydrolase